MITIIALITMILLFKRLGTNHYFFPLMTLLLFFSFYPFEDHDTDCKFSDEMMDYRYAITFVSSRNIFEKCNRITYTLNLLIATFLLDICIISLFCTTFVYFFGPKLKIIKYVNDTDSLTVDQKKYFDDNGIHIFFTVVCTVNTEININELLKNSKIDKDIIEIKKHKGFYNCIQCKINIGSKNINSMVFRNGKIRITNCRNIDELNIVLGKLINLLAMDNVSNVDKENIKVIDFNRYTFAYYKLPFRICLENLEKIITNQELIGNKYGDIISKTLTDIYLKLKYENIVIYIFKSVIKIDGYNKYADIIDISKNINSFLKNHENEIKLVEMSKEAIEKAMYDYLENSK